MKLYKAFFYFWILERSSLSTLNFLYFLRWIIIMIRIRKENFIMWNSNPNTNNIALCLHSKKRIALCHISSLPFIIAFTLRWHTVGEKMKSTLATGIDCLSWGSDIWALMIKTKRENGGDIQESLNFDKN